MYCNCNNSVRVNPLYLMVVGDGVKNTHVDLTRITVSFCKDKNKIKIRYLDCRHTDYHFKL